jgi:hypothetical protein
MDVGARISSPAPKTAPKSRSVRQLIGECPAGDTHKAAAVPKVPKLLAISVVGRQRRFIHPASPAE